MAENGIPWRRDAEKALEEAKGEQETGARRLHGRTDVNRLRSAGSRGVPERAGGAARHF